MLVSMKSGLEDRNNVEFVMGSEGPPHVSMKSGLEDRNNPVDWGQGHSFDACLNEVRPGRPEQYLAVACRVNAGRVVSMKSGLEDRNNHAELIPGPRPADRVSMKSGLEDRNNAGAATSRQPPSMSQ